jgi:hypothetical protein
VWDSGGRKGTIVDDYSAVGSAAAVCALLDSMVALVRRLADVVGLSWSGKRRVTTTLRLGLDIIDAIDHPALMCVAWYLGCSRVAARLA